MQRSIRIERDACSVVFSLNKAMNLTQIINKIKIQIKMTVLMEVFFQTFLEVWKLLLLDFLLI